LSQPVIHWFRRDLRLTDNTALHHAVESGHRVIGVFVFDERVYKSPRAGAPRMAFLLKALDALDVRLRQHGGRLIVRRGDPAEQLTALVNEANAAALYFNADYSPYARRRDAQVKEAVSCPVHVYEDALLMPPGSVLTADGKPYTVYTPFRNNWNKQTKRASVQTNFQPHTFHDGQGLTTHPLPSLAQLGFGPAIDVPEASEAAAADLLDAFIARGIHHYSETRNALPINPFAPGAERSTSYLSPYLRLGLISPRVCYEAARQAWSSASSATHRESIQTWVSELTWRDFYAHILVAFPHVLTQDFASTYRDLEWREAPDELQAWKDGMTGYPIVDAPMRQLKAIGWMPNRARMIVASFLTKHLLIHWSAGDQHFMQHLIDGDPASNNGGWQWSAGTGTDAQPYFRIFNPVSQSEKFATPAYLRHWLPELANVSDKFIHKPWEAPKRPVDYPPPIVDHGFARERTLRAFKKARGEKANTHET
jgi:deoxyribodipyrimidine photo-lyase